MATMIKEIKAAPVYYVVHPLDDVPEEKRNVEELGPMEMSASVRLSLLALRCYLVLMGLLVGYRAVAMGLHVH